MQERGTDPGARSGGSEDGANPGAAGSPAAAALGPVVLEGRGVRLEPLRPHHREALLEAAAFPEIWPWLSADLRAPDAMDRWIAEAQDAERRGTEFAFAVVLRDGGRAVGSTRYLDVAAAHRGVEIGWTWYTPAVWGSAVNPEAKLLLLRHAFESWGAVRVCLKTDGQNLRSQAAIARLGAVREGTLRQHRRRPDGSWRDTATFSVVAREWPGVRDGLLRRLAPPEGAPPRLCEPVGGA